MNFHETKMWQRFFDQQFPQLIEVLQKIAQIQTKPTAVIQLSDLTDGETDILSILYDCNYIPESLKRKQDDPLDQNVSQTMKALLDTLSPQQRTLFCEYEAAENIRGNRIACRAYRDGVQLAVQILLAGCSSPTLAKRNPHRLKKGNRP